MSKVAVAVKLKIKAGQRDAFSEAVKPGLATAQGEAGTLTYIFHHDAWMKMLFGSMSCTQIKQLFRRTWEAMHSRSFRSHLQNLLMVPQNSASSHLLAAKGSSSCISTRSS